jgi:hypothetical protein
MDWLPLHSGLTQLKMPSADYADYADFFAKNNQPDLQK